MEKHSPTQISDQIKARDVQIVTKYTATKSTTSQETLAPDPLQLNDGQVDNAEKSTHGAEHPKMTKRSQNSGIAKQPVCPHELKSRKTLEMSLSGRGNDVK